MNLGLWIIVIVGGLSGGLSCLYMIVSLFGTIGYKIYRKCKFGISLYD